MNIFLHCTTNLGDFLNGFPVISGMAKAANTRVSLIMQPQMRRISGVREFFLHHPMFERVLYADEPFHATGVYNLTSWTREDKNNPLRPTETCRYENHIRDTYGLDFEVDDEFELIVPDLGLPLADFYIGDRWSKSPDPRRAEHQLSSLTGGQFLSFDNDLTTNAYLIKHSPKPFVSCFTGAGILADLMRKETLIAWKPEDFAPEFRRGDDVWWDNKNIKGVFDKHYYGDRNSRLIHARDIQALIDRDFRLDD